VSGPVIVLATNVAFSTVVFAAAARLYVAPRLGGPDPRPVLVPILLLHSTRHLGLMFLSTGATYPGLAPAFAYPAALGDFLAAVLALSGLLAVVRRARVAKLLVWIFNLEGSLDLIVAIVLATVLDAGAYMGAAYWIPAFWVPALLVTHFLVFGMLRRPWSLETSPA
jgi:hypothetical protein